MRQIVKKEPPHELRIWLIRQPLDEKGKPLNSTYDDMPSEIKAIVKTRLLEEQGFLCCYTGIMLSEERSHIEHFKPQSLCENNEDVAYYNLLAAHPGLYQPPCPFGAHAKANWYDRQLMIDPLDISCEKRFVYTIFGHIRSRSKSDLAAQQTIQQLQLDHEQLVDLRLDAINRQLFAKPKPMSNKKLQSLIDRYSKLDPNMGKLPPFCFVIYQAAQELLEKRKKEQKKQQYRKKQK